MNNLPFHKIGGVREAIDDLWAVIADRLSAFRPDECENYFSAAGYDPEYVESDLVRQQRVFDDASVLHDHQQVLGRV